MKISLMVILLLYIFKETFEYFLQHLNLRNIEKFGFLIPPEFEGEIDIDLLRKTYEYIKDKTRFSFVSSLFNNVITIIFFFGGLLNIYNSWISSLKWPFLVTGLLFFLLLSYVSTFISVPFNLYSTFKIENKYGFNTTTLKLWVTDFTKTIILSTVLITLIAVIALWIIQSSPSYWWIWIWGFFLIFSIFMMYISPYIIEPLFNKFTPVEEQGLEDKIKELMKKVHIRVSRVFQMDASKRSHHTNAYFSGIGRVKRIILYDTLLEKMNHDEIVSVLAHEAGHWKKRHILKMILAAEIVSFICTYISFRIIQSEILTDIFHINNGTFFAKVIILAFIGSIISFPFIPIGNYISRRFEKDADKFACELTNNKNAMISALIKLSKDNLSNLYPHPIYTAFYYSHPPVVQRIRDIKKLQG